MPRHLTPVNEITLHYKRPHINDLPKIAYSCDVVDYLFQVLDKNRLDLKEFSWVALMTSNNDLLGISEVSSGTTTSVDINVREIIQLSLLTNAVRVIIIHNHPNGDSTPSKKDIEVAIKLEEIASCMEIHLVDSLVISSESVISLKKRELI